MDRAPHPFSLRQLQYVVAIAEHRSFRRAAEECRVAQPSLSTQVAQLEEVLGVKLFERGRPVLPTPAGEEIIARAQRLLRDASELLDSAKRFGDPFAGSLRVGILPTISPYFLPDVAPALRAKYPRLELLWVEDKTSALVAELELGKLDVALLALEAEMGELESAVIGRDPFVLATSCEDPLGARAGRVSPSELDGARVLLLEDGHCLRDQALSYCARTNAEETGYRATSLPTLVQMVAGGAGVTLLPELAVLSENRRKQLHIREFKAPAPGRTLALVWRKRSPRTAAFAKIAESMRAVYARMERRKEVAETRGSRSAASAGSAGPSGAPK